MMDVVRKHLFRAVATVACRTGMDMSIAQKIWNEMAITMVAVPDPHPVPAVVREGPALLAAAPADEPDYGDREPGGWIRTTPKRPTKPVEPMAPPRPVKPEPEAESVAGSEEKEDTKLTPQQKLERQKQTTTEKLDKLRARQGTAKQTAKQKEADPKEIAKLEEKLAELNTKLEKFVAKAAKPNFEKWTPTWTKHFKTAADGARMVVNDDTKTGFVQYLNRLTPEAFKKPSYLEHAQEYFKQRAAAGVGLVADPAAKPVSKPEPVPEPEEELDEEEVEIAVAKPEDDDDEEVYEVTYDGELYTVGEHSRKVYKVTDEGDVPVTHLDDIKAVLGKLDKQLGKK